MAAVEERFALMVEASESGLWERMDLGDGSEWWSARMYELLGYTPATIEAHADSFASLLHPDDREYTLRAIDAQVRGLRRLSVECRLLTRGGAYRWFQLRGAVVLNPDGTPQRLAGSLTDVHDRHLAATELDRFINLSVDLVCIVDVDGHFARVSPSFVETLGYSESELLGVPFADFVHPDDLETSTTEFGAVVGSGSTGRFHNRFRHENGKWVWLSWTARADSTGRVYAIARDVTDERRARDELAQHAAELELTNEELEQFAYVASHDLQEPLRTIASYAGLLESRYADDLDSDGRDFLAFMREAADRMRALIRALLDYSRLGRQSISPDSVDLTSVAKRVVDDLNASIEAAGAKVRVAPLPSVHCDGLLISLVFQNLIANAIKFRGDEPPVVNVSAERTPTGWRVDVQDNGIGVAAVHRERVFEVFKRLHPRTRYDGTGIGLAVCKRVLQQHGGTIWCAEATEGGSVFSFVLPNQERRR